MSVTAALKANEEAIAGDAANARVVFSTQGSLVGPTHVKLVSRGHAIDVDEPDVLAGGDQFANPVEYALASLASCQAITYRFWAAKLGIELDGVEVAVEGDLDLHGFFGLDETTRAGLQRHPPRRDADRSRARGALPRAGRRRRRALPGARPVQQPDAGRAPAGGDRVRAALATALAAAALVVAGCGDNSGGGTRRPPPRRRRPRSRELPAKFQKPRQDRARPPARAPATSSSSGCSAPGAGQGAQHRPRRSPTRATTTTSRRPTCSARSTRSSTRSSSTTASPTTVNPLIDKAVEAGIPVVAFDVETENQEVVSIQQSDVDAGKRISEELVKGIGGKGDVGYVYVAGFAPLDRRNRGWKRGQEGQPGHQAGRAVRQGLATRRPPTRRSRPTR